MKRITLLLLAIGLQFVSFSQRDGSKAREQIGISNLEDYEKALLVKDKISRVGFSGYLRLAEAIKAGSIDFTIFPNLSTFHCSTSILDSFTEVKLFQNLAKCNLTNLTLNSNYNHNYALFSHIPQLALSGKTVNNNESLIELKNLKEIELYYEDNGYIDSSDALFELNQIELLAIQGYSDSTFPFKHIGNLDRLKHLYIETDVTLLEFPEQWKNLEQLEVISSKNSFVFDSLPTFFYTSQNLRSITLTSDRVPYISAELFEKKGLDFFLRIENSSTEAYRAWKLNEFLERKLKYPFKLRRKKQFQANLDRILCFEPKGVFQSDYYLQFEYWTEEYP